MAKKAVTKERIQKSFQDYLLNEGKEPKTVRIFTNHQKISEDEFYQHFGSLKNIESSIWEDYYRKTLEVLHKDPEFEEMSAREKHLSFLFTMLELIKPDRSYILCRLEGKNPGNIPKYVKNAQKIVVNADIDWASTFQFLPDGAQNFTQSAYRRVLAQHTIALLFFWVKDDTGGSKDTDIFIEKSTRTVFDIGELPALDSIFDLSKFFIQKMGFAKATA